MHRGQANSNSWISIRKLSADYDKVIDLQPNYAEVYTIIGVLVQVKLGHYRKAIADYNKAIQLINLGADKT